ncbi:hypothetical protein MJN69_27455, partial [Salmonella enterica subsp. enterica serovar Kentucky]|nr:hypothetical protein [Salmonella enterica subsp. enterica serovar Kentucky]
SPTNIPLLITAASSALLGVFAFCLPDTPPKSTGKMDIKVMLGMARLVEEAGADMIECNFSCPQMTSHAMGSDVGQSPELVEKYCR